MLRARPRHPLKSLSGSLVVALVGVDAEGRAKIRGSDSLFPLLYGLARCRTDLALISIFNIGPVKKADSTVRKPFIIDILPILPNLICSQPCNWLCKHLGQNDLSRCVEGPRSRGELSQRESDRSLPCGIRGVRRRCDSEQCNVHAVRLVFHGYCLSAEVANLLWSEYSQQCCFRMVFCHAPGWVRSLCRST